MTLLADTSAIIASQRRGGVSARVIAGAARDGDLWTCDMVRLELMAGATNHRHMAELRATLDTAVTVHTDDRAWRRALDVYEGLARMRGGRHRGIPHADLLIAATAEVHDLSLLHDDGHFELIGAVTGQRMARLP